MIKQNILKSYFYTLILPQFIYILYLNIYNSNIEYSLKSTPIYTDFYIIFAFEILLYISLHCYLQYKITIEKKGIPFIFTLCYFILFKYHLTVNYIINNYDE